MEGLGTVYDRVLSEQPNKKRLLFIPVSVLFFFPNSVPVSVFVPIFHIDMVLLILCDFLKLHACSCFRAC